MKTAAKIIERQVLWFAFFGIDYACLRYLLHGGHLSAGLAFVSSGVSMAVVRLEKA